jgi:hypothetical protein
MLRIPRPLHRPPSHAPSQAWATQTIGAAHLAKGHWSEGSSFMRNNRDDWESSTLAVHLYGQWAGMMLENDAVEQAVHMVGLNMGVEERMFNQEGAGAEEGAEAEAGAEDGAADGTAERAEEAGQAGQAGSGGMAPLLPHMDDSARAVLQWRLTYVSIGHGVPPVAAAEDDAAEDEGSDDMDQARLRSMWASWLQAEDEATGGSVSGGVVGDDAAAGGECGGPPRTQWSAVYTCMALAAAGRPTADFLTKLEVEARAHANPDTTADTAADTGAGADSAAGGVAYAHCAPHPFALSAAMDPDAACHLAATTQATLPLCRALVAHSQGRYEEVVQALLPLRYHLRSLGGTALQRDLVPQTLIQAALRSGQFHLARQLLAERTARRPAGPLSFIWTSECLEGLEDWEGAQAMRYHAQSLGFAQGGWGAH